MTEQTCPYRSPKKAAREEAVRLQEGAELRNLEASSPYNAEKHLLYPRATELKPSRFAVTAVLMDRLGDYIFEGEDDQIRLPALEKLRDRPDQMFPSDKGIYPLMQLSYDWEDMDHSLQLKDVLSNPQNQYLIDAYAEISEDIASDPNAEEPIFASEDVREELASRIDPRRSFETHIGGVLLIKWALEQLPPNVTTSEEKRQFIIGLIPFFERMSELEIEHLHEYYLRTWNDFHQSGEEAGVTLTRDAAGAHTYKLTKRRNKPEQTSGMPVGCPAGFSFESAALGGIKGVSSKPSLLKRSLIAFVNEAYDRDILE